MKYTITFREMDFLALHEHLFQDTHTERAAYLFCRTSESSNETRLLVREICPIREDDIEEATATNLRIKQSSYTRALKYANDRGHAFVFVHSHPPEFQDFSPQDDLEEAKLFNTAYNRSYSNSPHASLVLTPDRVKGRCWFPDQTNREITLVRVIGDRFQFLTSQTPSISADVFDRQVRAFGPGLQEKLKSLRVGVVGCGGTGSAVVQQLARLGVGMLYLFDGDRIDASNVTRVYGSGLQDQGAYKVDVMQREVERIGLATQTIPINRSITFKSAAKMLRECDVLFGCTDDEWGRSILTRAMVYYFIPVIDMGVRIDSSAGMITSVQGRVTVLVPGAACLLCRGRIGPNIGAEVLRATDPEKAESLRQEGYIPELDTRQPSVISFNSAVAASAVTELLHRLTGFRHFTSSEMLHLFDENRVRTNSAASDPACICANSEKLGKGDCEPLLDMTWRADA